MDYIIRIRADDEESDVALWKWLRELLIRLKAEGMSSDESDVDEYHRKVYRVTIMVWRRQEITDCMKLIDKERDGDDGGYSAQGAQPRMRIRGTLNADSSRKPVRGLPRKLYDERWFEKNHRKFSMNVLREQFQWINITAGG